MTAVACRMPQYLDDPDTFNPARFDPEKKNTCALNSVLSYVAVSRVTIFQRELE